MKKLFLVVFLFLIVGCTYFLPEEKISKKSEQKIGLFKINQEQLQNKMKAMSLEEKVGQLFLARMDSETINEEIKKYYPGGYVLFARDFEGETKESMKEKISGYQKQSKIPLIMAVDEEGGIVTRVSRFQAFREQRFASSQELYEQGGYSLIEEVEQEKIALLKSLGLNLNLAPVADISTNPEDYIYSRSFGKDKMLTSEYVRRVVSVNYQNHFANSLKHFPGYGNNVDTHTGIAIDEKAYQDLEENDYLPFQAGIKEKVPTILVSHNIVKALDEKYPASLSPKIHQELRRKLNFQGLIITDDLSMDAILDYTHSENSAVLAVQAGNDLIITSDFATDYQAVLDAVRKKKIKTNVIHEAVERILAFKSYYLSFA